MKVKIPVPDAPLPEAPVPEAPVPNARITEALVPDAHHHEAPVPEAPIENEADIVKLWEEIKKVTPVVHHLEHAQRIMRLLDSNDLRKEFCSVLIAPEFLDTAMCPPLFGWQEVGEEPCLDELRDALGKINLHQFAIQTWVDLSSKKRKTE